MQVTVENTTQSCVVEFCRFGDQLQSERTQHGQVLDHWRPFADHPRLAFTDGLAAGVGNVAQNPDQLEDRRAVHCEVGVEIESASTITQRFPAGHDLLPGQTAEQLAHASAGLQPGDAFPADIAGKVFTFGSKGSTSGRLMPEYHIRQYFGKTPEQVFSKVGFSGNHSKTIALVQSGAYQAGAVNFKVWERELEEGKIDPGKVSVIWKMPAYPDYQWSIRGDVDARWGEGFKEKVRAALLNMDDPALLASFPRSGFIAASNADFQPILDTAREIGLID